MTKTRQATAAATMWKPPARRDYAPKPLDPGQPISWALEIPGRWTAPPSPVDLYGKRPETWIPGETVTRTGRIWSAGPVPSSLWVLPAGETFPVAVKLPTAMRAERGDRPAEMAGYGVTWQRDTIRRCEHLRASGPVFAEYRTESRYDYSRGGQTDVPHTVAYHCDPRCPAIQHDTRACWEWEPSIGSVTRMLLDASARGRSDLCRTCIYLSEPATAAGARELVNA